MAPTDDDPQKVQLTDAEQAIIEMLKKQSMGQPIAAQQVQAIGGADDKKHAFWGTQVSVMIRYGGAPNDPHTHSQLHEHSQ